VNWLGDAVISSTALSRLKEALPQSSITLFCPEKLAPLWQQHPAVQQILSFPTGSSAFAAASLLRREKFDLALIFPNSFRSALEPWLAGVPKRIGYGGRGRRLLLTRTIPRPLQKKMRKRSDAEVKALIRKGTPREENYSSGDHHIFHYLNLVAALGANATPRQPELFVSEVEVRNFLMKCGLDPSLPVFGLNPGAEYGPAKRWPLERFAEAAIRIHQRQPARWVVFGGSNDKALAEELCLRLQTSGVDVLNLAGSTSLRELMAGLKCCRALLTNDTGPMHVAAALGTRVIVPFGSTSPELTGPGLPGRRLHALIKGEASCAPCFRRECPIDFRCMRAIPVDLVVETFLKASVAPTATE
jgi:heptosyltransferase-2